MAKSVCCTDPDPKVPERPGKGGKGDEAHGKVLLSVDDRRKFRSETSDNMDS